VMEMLNVSAKEQLEAQGAAAGFTEIKASSSGFIMYQTDNYGDLTPESVTMDCLDQRNWKKEMSQPGEFQEAGQFARSEEHTSELQSRFDLVCRLLLEKKN